MNLYLDNSNVIELRDLKNSVTLSADTGATVQVTITDAAGAEVSGETSFFLLNSPKSSKS
jgi:hypothetical protein